MYTVRYINTHMYETLTLSRVSSFYLPFMNSLTLKLVMPRPSANWETLDRVSDQLRASTPLQPGKGHMILIEWKTFLTPDSVWAFSRKEKSLA